MALVHDWLNGMRGGERVFEHFCALLPEADVFTLFYEPERLSTAIRAMRVHESALARRFPAARRHYRKLLPILPAAVARFPTAGYDIVISTSHCVAKGTPPPRKGMHLSYVFSPMRYVWDHYEDYLSGRFVQDTALGLARKRLQEWDRRTAQQIDAIAADSHHIADKIARFWERRARVIHPSVDVDFFTPGDGPNSGHFLVVSALVPYKRVERAIEASRLAGRPLVIVGDGPERAALQALAHKGVQFRGWVSDEELREEYRRCRALLYPGVEDYGLTALEAQACGRPVLALRRGGAVETIVEGETGAFFDEPEAQALAELMTAFDAMTFDPHAIRRHAEQFSPARFRRQLAEWILEEGRIRCW